MPAGENEVGVTVLVLSASDSSTGPYVGQTGRLLADDKSGRPFKVEFRDGTTCWFKEGELQKVADKDTARAVNLAPQEAPHVGADPMQRALDRLRELKELADKQLQVGDRVRRGSDWRRGGQDGGPGNTGTVNQVDSDGWVAVKWDKGGGHRYCTATLCLWFVSAGLSRSQPFRGSTP